MILFITYVSADRQSRHVPTSRKRIPFCLCCRYGEGYNPGKETTPVHRDKKKRKNRVSLKLFIGGSLYFIPLHYLRTSSSKTGRN